MSRVELLAKTEIPATARRGIAAGAFAAAVRALTRFRRAARPDDCDWSRLNARLLADIGETPAAAERAALLYPPNAPLGLIGGRVEIGGRPLFAHRTSPLG